MKKMMIMSDEYVERFGLTDEIELTAEIDKDGRLVLVEELICSMCGTEVPTEEQMEQCIRCDALDEQESARATREAEDYLYKEVPSDTSTEFALSG